MGIRACMMLLCVSPILACAPAGAFVCQADAQCSGGRCEPDGWCSFPDGNCDSGQRYGEHAGGGLAGQCVPTGDTDVIVSETESASGDTAGPTTIDPSTPSTTTTAPATESPETTSSTGVCGDGTQDADEACDDGNELDGDGCDNDCTESGETLWTYTFEGPGPDVVRDVLLFSDGSVVACGDTSLASADSIPAVIALDADGNEIITVPLQDAGTGSAWGLVGNEMLLVVAGTRSEMGDAGFFATITVDEVIETFTVPLAVFDVASYPPLVMLAGSTANGSASVVAYNTAGELIQQHTLQQLPLLGAAWDLAIPPETNDIVYVAGADESSAQPWIGAVPPGGEAIWNAFWSVPGNGAAYGITLDNSGNVLVTGSVDASGIISVIDPEAGEERWSQTITAARGDFANIHKAAPGPSGEVVAIGWTSTSATDADIWIGKYSSEGTLLWQRTFAGTSDVDSNGWGITVDGAGLITGVGGLHNDDTGYDAWIVRLEP